MLKVYFFIPLIGFFMACQESMPKPSGHPRLEYPEARYRSTETICPYRFEYSDQAAIVPSTKKKCWIDLNYNNLNASIHLSYLPIEGNLTKLLKDAEELLNIHLIKADSEYTAIFENPKNRVYGQLTSLGGGSASNIQFYLTDSVHHFLLGSLYFHVRPQYDSLQPAIEYLEKDVRHLAETLSWK